MFVNFKKYFKLILLSFLSILISLLICEATLRIKNSIVPDYDIEMWKYAKKLKQKSPDKSIGHTHLIDKSAVLQKVKIETNNYGMRDIFINNDTLNRYDRSFLFLGSSITLGWGVENSKTFINLLNETAKKNNQSAIFMNGGVGNYNTKRYINNFLKNWSALNYTDLVIVYFVNDSEILEDKKTNFFIKHSHFAVNLWKLLNSYKSKFQKENLVEYYEKLYEKDFQGLIEVKNQLKIFKDYCTQKKLNCSLINMPDIHNLNPYKLKFINKTVKKISNDLDINFYDLTYIFEGINEERLWNRYNDPHPNEYAHKLIANSIYDFLVN